ncbi:HET-domain-containing protein [Acephala macrosclerotiorum]|nr:HET-domain-containing protein [Acephala macrosclerotiorum]
MKHENVTVYTVRKPVEGFHENPLDPLELEYPDNLQLKSTGSFINLKMARLWMNECLGSHQQCTAGAASHSAHPPLPNRILEVEESGRLVLRESKGQYASYMTLSYCWGNTTRYLTTKDNIHELLQAVPTEDLPLTFQHAATVCRFLGCRYLWIDALCIIQDSPGDVESELASMGDIYRNSILTITAAGGFNANSGLFASRDPRWNRPCEISGFVNEEGQVFEFGGYIRLAGDRSSYNLSEPLYARAWVYQEEVLSTRELIFGSDQMSWLCMSYAGNETMPVLNSEEYSHRQIRWALRDPHNPEISNGDIFFCWYLAVKEYNSRSLTYLADKLRAIAGLATKFQELYGATYLAGIWKEDIQCGLSWYRTAPWYRKPDPNQTPRSDPSLVGGEQVPGDMEYVAPSWSWASTHIAGIEFTSQCYEPRSPLGVQLLHYDIRRPSNALNAFDRVTYGALKIRGRARSGKLCPIDEEQDTEDRELGYLRGAKWGANCVDAEHPEEWIGEVILDNESIHELVQSQGFVKVLCLLVVACPGVRGICKWSLSAVVVVPINEKAEIFRRVGLLKCQVSEDFQSWFGDLSYEDDVKKSSKNDCTWTRTLTIL